MSRFMKRKKILVLSVVVVAAALAGGAFAYFTSTGSGTGSATVGASSAIQLSSAAVGTLYPGGAAVPVSVSVHNPGGAAERVSTISGSVADNGGCLGAWFQVDSITFNTDVAAGATVTAGPTNVQMLESGTNQDACIGKSMTINWASN
jgi:hypothetical protein